MKQITALLLIFSLFSCNETKKKTEVTTPPVGTEVLDTLIPTPEMARTYQLQTESFARRPKPIKQVPQPTPTPTPTPTSTGIPTVYLNFKGGTVTSGYWNGGQTFTVAASNLNEYEQSVAVNLAQRMFEGRKIILTTDLAVYDAASVKAIAYIGPRPSIFGTGHSGYAKIGTLRQGVPFFVFSDVLYDIGKYVGAIIGHELGHSIGLAHQSEWSTSCTLVNSYRRYTAMGYPFDMDLAPWVTGPTNYGCNNIQDDNDVLNRNLP